MEMSREVIEAALGVRPLHLAYPVGDPTSAGQREFRIAGELGFKPQSPRGQACCSRRIASISPRCPGSRSMANSSSSDI
jgi:hypothetical protein